MALHFVNVVGGRSHAHRGVHDVTEEKNRRAFVMRHYLQHRSRPVKSSLTPPAVSSLSDHMNQFPLLSRQGRKRPSTKPKKIDSATTHRVKPAIQPKGIQDPREAVLFPPLQNGLFDRVQLPIDTARTGTSALLEYYHTSFWDNSLAVNPEGQWISVAISDPAMLHATLCLVALHKMQTRGGGDAMPYLWHRGEAMRLISKNLTDPSQAISDANIAAISILSASDNATQGPSFIQESHMEGLLTLLRLRGGIGQLSTNRHIQRVVAWADVLHASVHSVLPTLGTAHYTCVKPSAHGESASRLLSPTSVPIYFRDILENLRALADMKSVLTDRPASSHQKMRKLFSDLLFLTEYSILELQPSAIALGTPWRVSGSVDAIKAAALIFTFQNLRDMAITATFFDPLLQRLREGLSIMHGDAFSEWHSPNPSSGMATVALPLWLCLNGWKACAIKSRQSERTYFVEMVARFCELGKIDSSDEFISCINQIVCSTADSSSHCVDIWTEVKEWTAV